MEGRGQVPICSHEGVMELPNTCRRNWPTLTHWVMLELMNRGVALETGGPEQL